MTTLNGQVIGQAHYATRALLERVLARVGITFEQSVAYNVVTANDGKVDRSRIVDRLVTGLKIDAVAAEASIDGLVASGLLDADGSQVSFTASGREVSEQIQAAVAEIIARLYGDLPAADLSTAARVLATVTERANAQLGAA